MCTHVALLADNKRTQFSRRASGRGSDRNGAGPRQERNRTVTKNRSGVRSV